MSSILVVDDELDNFDVIETLLSDQDYQLHYAASGNFDGTSPQSDTRGKPLRKLSRSLYRLPPFLSQPP